MQAEGGWNFPQVGPVACLALVLAGPLPPHHYQEKDEVGTRLKDQSLQTPVRQKCQLFPGVFKRGGGGWSSRFPHVEKRGMCRSPSDIRVRPEVCVCWRALAPPSPFPPL